MKKLTPKERLIAAEQAVEDMAKRLRQAERKAADASKRLRDMGDSESLIKSLRDYLRAHQDTIHTLEHELFVADAWIENARRDVKVLTANPLVVPRSREKLPDTRESITWTMRVGPRENRVAATVQVGLYPDGRVGEVFLEWRTRSIRGTHATAMADFACTMLSIAIQYGAPLKDQNGETGLLSKMLYASDGSGGITQVRRPDGKGYMADPQCPQCSSLRDYLGKKLAINTDENGRWTGKR